MTQFLYLGGGATAHRQNTSLTNRTNKTLNQNHNHDFDPLKHRQKMLDPHHPIKLLLKKVPLVELLVVTTASDTRPDMASLRVSHL